MASQSTPAPTVLERDAAADTDLTGRDRLSWNVLASWAGHSVFIIFGFIVPRMIDGRLGRESLGVWDFGWSLVSYFALVQGGVVSSVNRYVSRYRAVEDWGSINRAVSSVTGVLVVMAGVVSVLTIAATLAVPRLMGQQLGDQTGETAWVVCFLGMSLATQIGFAAFGGVLTGHHRWDLHNAIHAGAHTLTASGMITVLLLGGGLRALAFVVLCGELFSRTASWYVAHRVCPTLRVRFAYARWDHARRMLVFGGKGFLPYLGDLLLNSTTSVLIVLHLGPAALALYARPMALVRHARTLVQKFAFVLTPTASSLQAMGQPEEVRRLLVDATRYGAYIALPMVMMLVILGGPILHLWMGPDYDRHFVIAILALGHLAVMVQRPALSVLAGLNKHGRPGLANLVAALVAIAGVAIGLWRLDAGLEGAALAVVLPLALVNAIYVPLCACASVRLNATTYITRALLGPALCMIPFGLCLATARLAFPGDALSALTVGVVSGFAVLTPLYWRYVLDNAFKRRFAEMIGFRKVHLVDSAP